MTDTGTLRCMVIGDINVDTVMHTSEFPSEGGDVLATSSQQRLGGSGCNTAVVLAQLGIDTSMVGHLGTDPFGRFAMQILEGTGLNLQLVRQDSAYTTGHVTILVTARGERTMLAYRGSNAEPVPVDRIDELLGEVDWLHVSGYTLVEDLLWQTTLDTMIAAKQKHIRTSFDPGVYTTKQVPERILSAAEFIDDLLASEREVETLAPAKTLRASCEQLLDLGIGAVAIKMGAEGSLYVGTETSFRQPAIQTKERQVVDTTGAGDVFNAGYIFGHLQGLDPGDCLLLGNAVGYLKVTSPRAAAELSGNQDLRERVAKLVK